MRKIILTTAALFAFGFANAQFNVGVHVGLPTGDIKDVSSLNVGGDIGYAWNVAEGLDAGIAAGYSSYLGKDGRDAVGFIPVVATGKFTIGESLFFGADLGYAIGASDGNDGGFMYQPKVGYSASKIDVYLGYKGISVDGGTFSSVNLGMNFKL
ncbi:hypothetical protein [Flavobacterium faecale]|uniref:hypothetical protein n=1 Tax=Flavobacterium faecale TaxID=1355330 RepID=UPI003AAAAB1F